MLQQELACGEDGVAVPGSCAVSGVTIVTGLRACGSGSMRVSVSGVQLARLCQDLNRCADSELQCCDICEL